VSYRPLKGSVVAGLSLALLTGSTASGGADRPLAPVTISVEEGILANDDSTASPPANVTITEAVAAGDSAVVGPALSVAAPETVSVDEAVTVKPSPPTAVTLRSFTAGSATEGVLLTWRTAASVQMLGFNLYRGQRGKIVKVNRSLIPSVFGGSAKGHTYSWLDRSARRAVKYTYRLQAISLAGTRVWLGTAIARR
jgi:hypothetical protein